MSAVHTIGPDSLTSDPKGHRMMYPLSSVSK